MPAFVRLRRSKRVRIHPKPFLIFFHELFVRSSSFSTTPLGQHISSFYNRPPELQKLHPSRLVEQRNVLCVGHIRRRHFPPSSLYVRAVVFDDTLCAPLQIFFAAPLRKYPYDGCGNFTCPCARIGRCWSRDARDAARSSFTHVACRNVRRQKRQRPHVAGVVCHQMGIDARRANQKVSQSSAVAAVCAGAGEAATGLRAGAAAATRFGGASRSSRAAAWTGTATVAAAARGA